MNNRRLWGILRYPPPYYYSGPPPAALLQRNLNLHPRSANSFGDILKYNCRILFRFTIGNVDGGPPRHLPPPTVVDSNSIPLFTPPAPTPTSPSSPSSSPSTIPVAHLTTSPAQTRPRAIHLASDMTLDLPRMPPPTASSSSLTAVARVRVSGHRGEDVDEDDEGEDDDEGGDEQEEASQDRDDHATPSLALATPAGLQGATVAGQPRPLTAPTAQESSTAGGVSTLSLPSPSSSSMPLPPTAAALLETTTPQTYSSFPKGTATVDPSWCRMDTVNNNNNNNNNTTTQHLDLPSLSQATSTPLSLTPTLVVPQPVALTPELTTAVSYSSDNTVVPTTAATTIAATVDRIHSGKPRPGYWSIVSRNWARSRVRQALLFDISFTLLSILLLGVAMSWSPFVLSELIVFQAYVCIFVCRSVWITLSMWHRALYLLPQGLVRPDPDIDHEASNQFAVFMAPVFTWHGVGLMLFAFVYIFPRARPMSYISLPIVRLAVCFGFMGMTSFFIFVVLMIIAVILYYTIGRPIAAIKRRWVSRRHGGHGSGGTTNTVDLSQLEAQLAAEDAENGQGSVDQAGELRNQVIKYPSFMNVMIDRIPKQTFRKAINGSGNEEIEVVADESATEEGQRAQEPDWPVVGLEAVGTPDCAICLVDYQDLDTLRRLPGCDHYFHSACIIQWLVKGQSHCSFSCPTCRHELTIYDDY